MTTVSNASDVSREVALVESSSRPSGVTLVNTLQTTKMNDCMDLVELARQVQKADEFTRANAGNKLTVIADQIKHLQEEAMQVLLEARRDADLHHVACNMVKKPGTTYHLYGRESGQRYLSILSPQEWGSSCPHEFLGSYFLEMDMSWTPVDKLDKRKEEKSLVDSILNAQLAVTSESSDRSS